MPHLLGRMRLSDPKTDIFLGANVLDAFLTYLALQEGAEVTEFNGILYTIMDTIGSGAALFLKVALCIVIVWALRKRKREKLLVPLAAIFVLVALSNLLVIRLQGIEI